MGFYRIWRWSLTKKENMRLSLIKLLIVFLLAGGFFIAVFEIVDGHVPTTGEAEVSVRSMLYIERSNELVTLVTVKNTSEDEEPYSFNVMVEVYHDPEEPEPELVGESEVYTTSELSFEEEENIIIQVTLDESLERSFQASALASKDE